MESQHGPSTQVAVVSSPHSPGPLPAIDVRVRNVDAFEQYVRSGLELAGVEVDDTEMAVMRAADRVYGPGFRALAEADLSDVMIEADLDPGRPPMS